jgi:SAM-dependent methyltransferase
VIEATMAVPASAEARYHDTRVAHWDQVARASDRWSGLDAGYHRRLESIYRILVPPKQRVAELGCGRADLLAALQPTAGVGVDFSPEMTRRAAERHPALRIVTADVHDLTCLKDDAFDYIVLSDLADDLWDVQTVLAQARRLCHDRTRIVLNGYSRLWEAPLAAARRLRLANPVLRQNWLTVDDLTGLLRLTDFEVVRAWPEILWPLGTPLIAGFFNRGVAKVWPFSAADLTNFIVAKPITRAVRPPRVSVIVPARNEAGNIAGLFERTPEMGSGTELVFVEGHSKDDTYATIAREIEAHPARPCQLHRQSRTGKGDAVRLGFAKASGEVLMILDADLTMPPEDLPRFYEALVSGRGEFINGARLVYPMEDQAMRFFNFLGNKFFSLAFSWLLGQPIKDTLCGTKVLWKADYERIAANRAYFGDFDPFGDFDLIFGASKLGLKIVELPVRYRARQYGTTNIQRWTHGWLLLRMVLFAARRIKFV